MFGQRINLQKLYEQNNIARDGHPIDVDSNELNRTIPKENKKATYAFPITEEIDIALNKLINAGSGEWKSDTPIKTFKEGPQSNAAMLNNKPVYLIIRIGSDKAQRKNTRPDLELSDRVYVLFDTSATELKNILNQASGPRNAVNVGVKTPVGSEHNLQIWKKVTSTDFKPLTNNIEATGSTVDINQNSGQNVENKIDALGAATGIDTNI